MFLSSSVCNVQEISGGCIFLAAMQTQKRDKTLKWRLTEKVCIS
jgi:hypothetical protein